MAVRREGVLPDPVPEVRVGEQDGQLVAADPVPEVPPATDTPPPSGPAPGGRTSSPGAGHDPVQIAARHGSVSLLGAAFNAAGGFLLVLVLTRGLGAAQTGLVSAMISAMIIATKVGTLGADAGLVRTIARFRVLGRSHDIRRAIWTGMVPVLVLTSVTAILLFPSAGDIAAVLVPDADPDAGTAMVHLALVVVPFASLSAVMLGATRGFGAIWPMVGIEQIGKSGSRPVFAWAAISLGGGVVAVLASWSIPVALGLACAVWALARNVRRLTNGQMDPAGGSAPTSYGPLAKEFWSFSAPRAVSSTLELATLNIGVILLSAFSTSHEAGLYFTANRLVFLGALLVTAARMTVAPQYSSLISAGDTEGAQTLHRTTLSWVVTASFPLFATFLFFPHLALSLFGPEFAAAAAPLVILSIGMLIDSGTGNVQTLLLMSGRSSWNLLNSLLALGANVGLCLWLIPRYGAVAAAIAASTGLLVANALSVYQVRRYLGIVTGAPAHLIAGGAALACVGAAALGATIVGPETVWAQAIWCALGLLAYASVAGVSRTRLGLDHLAEGFRRRS